MGFAKQVVTNFICELLPHNFTIAGFTAEAVFFLLHFPSSCPAWPLASIAPFEVRTFLTLTKAVSRAVVESPE
jgi:hypothetical protein